METDKKRIAAIKTFIKEYAARNTEGIEGKKPDVKSITASFADSFIEASPKGIMAAENGKEFKEQIPKGYDFYKSVGTTAMKMVSNKITLLDELHSMAKVHWKAEYEKKDKSKLAIEFDVFYFLQDSKEALKIFAYITGDEEKALKDNGIVPYK